MFGIFKKDIQVGDKVKLYLTTGKEPEGTVVEIGGDFVLIQSDNQTYYRFFDKLIGGWELIINTKSDKQVAQVKKDDLPIVEQILEVAPSASTPVSPQPITECKVEQIPEVTPSDSTPVTPQPMIEHKGEQIPEVTPSASAPITTKPITEYKVGEKIPLELLSKVTDKKDKAPKIKGKPKSTFKSLDALEQLISPEEKKKLEDEAKIDDEKILSANGVITRYFADRYFGFIVDKHGDETYFDVRDIVDENLSQSLKSTPIKLQLPVIFKPSRNYKGNKAIIIHKPEKVGVIIGKAKEFSEKKDFNSAIGLIDIVLNSYPSNKLAIQLRNEFNTISKPWRGNPIKIKSNDINFQKAVKAKVDKDYDLALKYYTLAFENNEKRESCIKDIGMLYVQMGEPQKAIDFIKENEDELQKNITTYNYLANLYSSVKEFDKVIECLDMILNEKSVIKDKRKHSMYLSQYGFALIQSNKEDDARKVLNESLELLPENTYAERLLQALDEPDIERQNQIFAEAEFDSFGGGLSKFIKDTLDNYTEYAGVPAKIIDTGDFTKETLNAIRGLIDKAGRARPRERANYLLTEAKLMTSLEPEQETNLRSVLARYCNAMALNHVSENSSMDVIRNYYLEAFSLEENYKFTAPQVALFLMSYKSTYSDLLGSKTPSVDETLKSIIDNETKDNIWEGLLSMFLWNRSISANIIGKLYGNETYRNNSVPFLKKIGIKSEKKEISLEEYLNLWNNAREVRQRDFRRGLVSLKAIYANDNLETIVNQLKDSISDIKKNWLTSLDTSRLTIITTDIIDVVAQYIKQNGYRDKERLYGNAKTQVNQLINEIKEQPTKFSYEGYIPLLDKIILSLDNSFKAIESASIPIVKISILGEASIVTDKIVPVKIQVENSKNSSPIRDISVFIKDSNEVKSKEKAEYFDSVDGGEHRELHLKAELSNKVIQDKATTITVVFSYKRRNQEEPVIQEEVLSLRLYSEEEFETIANPYERLANGGPVTDTKMFYGRNEFIERITDAIIQTDSKQVVIYGQKRAGKSSVLHHLKLALKATNKTFCISFSIGDIYDDEMSSGHFFYKILSMIQEELESLEFEGMTVPQFICPDFMELKNAPNQADVFRKQIRLFKKACSTLNEWKDKKIVIMIDEFTYLYTAIKKKKISDGFMKQWKAITQNVDSMFSAVLVGQDVFPMFKDEFPNEFGVTQDERLTYLSKDDAVRLIEEPTGKTKSGRNRFIGDALDTIIDYTSCNPYYIQIFCARLVTEMNRKRYIEVTKADIKEIADSFINGGQALTDDKFDNLLNAGEEYDIQKYKQEVSKEILKNIAVNAKNIGFCLREQMSINDKAIDIDEVLKDLVKREVLEQVENRYKIQVKLFQEWLLKH
jgi:tetratricopeptide (TPR) repeat protein